MMDEETRRLFEKRSSRRELVEWIESLLFAFVLIVLIYTFFFRIITISGSSMENTLQHNDRVIVQGIAYEPKHGDVIVVDSFTDYGEPLVKRVIAMEGDEVDIDFSTGEVFVNGKVIDEPYLGSETLTQHDVRFPLTVDRGCLFVLGDNREVSLDSRSKEVGLIDERDVLGKVVFRLFPLSEMGGVK